MPRDESKPTIKPAVAEIAVRVTDFSPAKIRLLAREIKKSKGGIATEAESPGTAASPLVPIRSSGSMPPLFLVHPVGGGVAAYHDLAKYLRTEQPVFALQNLDSGNQAPTIEDMAACYIEAIQAVCPDRPCVLGGLSMGGVVAFEMAVQLRAQGRRALLVVMVDSPARIIRHIRRQDEHSSLAVELETLASIIASSQGTEAQVRLVDLSRLQPEEQINCVFNQLKQQQLLSADLNPSTFKSAVTAFVNNLNALGQYLPGSYDGRVVMLRAQDTLPLMRASAKELCDDPAFGWQAFCTQPVTVHFVPGDHYRLANEPYVQNVGSVLQLCIDEARNELMCEPRNNSGSHS